jgi:hypothetical protein
MIGRMTTDPWVSWALVGISLSLLLGYEGHAWYLGVRHPERHARHIHAHLRAQWVGAMAAQPGFEITAVQALRNSLMSATISASTAALAVMGAVTLAGSSLLSNVSHWSPDRTLHVVLQALLLLMLFASYVCSAMAMRYYSHATFVMSMPAASAERQELNPMAAEHVRRAGLLYSWGLRLFVMVAPIVTGIVHPLAMLPVMLVLLVALHYFDQPAKVEVELS